jgi:hypothetical protein
MAAASLDIERVVREVLAELKLATAPAAAVAKEAAPAPAPADNGGELSIAAQLVTMTDVSGRLGGIRRVVVTPHAIVTPAVRDELMRKNVALARVATSTRRAAGSLRLVLVVANKRFDPASLVESVGQDGVAVEQHRMDCLMAATDLLAAELAGPDTLGALVSSHAAAALCLANRHAAIRGVLGTDAHSAATATADVGANLLVIDPRAGTLFQWKKMLGEFCRNGVRRCPETLQKRLG